MAIRSLVQGARRSVEAGISRRLICTVAVHKKGLSLESEILRLKHEINPSMLIQRWVASGCKFTIYELRNITKLLLKSSRFNDALEVLKWMDGHRSFCYSPVDHAMRVELMVKTCNLGEAEEYFRVLPDSASRKAAAFPLLRGYVKERDTRKAEDFMRNLNELGLIVSPHLFNEMMKLYMATSEYKKVPAVILQMKQNHIPRNVLSYNLWLRACEELAGIAEAEVVYREMMDDENVQVGWSTLSTLANMYIRAGAFEKAFSALRCAEKKLSTCNHLGYFFIMTQYSSLKNKEGVLRLWDACKGVSRKMTCANYLRLLTCLIKADGLVEAERVFMEWESNCRKYDIRVSNVLLAAYMRNGMIEKAELFHLSTLEKGGCPNYKTWEILMEGWVKTQRMDKVIRSMRNAFARFQHCNWRPSHGMLLAIAENLENHQKLEDANCYIKVLHHHGIATLPLYKVILRMHIRAGISALDTVKMMEKDNTEMDDEALALVRSSCSSYPAV